jgi:hypothetical protein
MRAREHNSFGAQYTVTMADTMVDGVAVTSALMPTGQGNHFVSVSAALRKKLATGVGDELEVHITR